LLSETEVEVKAAIAIKAIVFANKSVELITDVNAGELDPEKINSLPGIVAFIAKDGDSLWDIGKEYYIPMQKILDTNNLSTDAVKPGQHILVVR